MVDIPDEVASEVDSDLTNRRAPEVDWSLADSLSASLPTPNPDEVLNKIIADQTEKRKLRPLIIGIGFMAAAGVGVVAVHVLRATKAHHPE